MYFLYMDESGVEDLRGQTSHFVLLGLAISSLHWKRYDQIINNIKTKYNIPNEEIHTAWMIRQYEEQKNIPNFIQLSPENRRIEVDKNIRKKAAVLGINSNQKKIKNYRKKCKNIRPYIHLTYDERIRVLHDLASEIGKWKYSRIFAEAISKSDFNIQIKSPYENAFEQVLTRFQAFLQYTDNQGVVIHDNNATVAPRLTEIMRKFHHTGTFFRKISNIIETPLFVDSSLTSMIQMSDLCAYTLRRCIENKEYDLWDLVKSRVDKKNGISVGIRYYTGRRMCHCSICQSHGRSNYNI